MKILKRLLATFMVVVMVLTAAPLSGFVGLESNLDWLNSDWFNFDIKASAETFSGTCGDELSWTLDTETDELVISGTGAMTDFEEMGSLWNSYSSHIKTVIINEGVESIGDYAFSWFDEIKSVTIPESVKEIGECAFSDCSSIEKANYPGTPEHWNNINIESGNGYLTRRVVFECNSEKPYYLTGACGDNLTYFLYDNGELVISGTGTMTDYGYYEAPWSNDHSYLIKEIIIGDGVESVGNYAFSECSRITSVIIPYGVKSIGSYAFHCCWNLTDVTIPTSVINIGDYIFDWCEELDTVYYTGTLEQWNDITIGSNNSILLDKVIIDSGSTRPIYSSGACGENLSYILYTDGELVITGYGKMTDFKEYDSPWYDCCDLIKTVIIDDRVESIGDYAFTECYRLMSVTIPGNVTYIGDHAFYGCSNITSIVVPDNVEVIGNCAFGECYRLEDITIADSVISIGEGAFAGCNSLANILIPDSVLSIGASTFCYCDKLVSIAIPSKVTSIEHSTFLDCERLVSVIIPDSVTNIGGSAFSGCSILEGINIPDSVVSIGDSAFSDCASLTSISIPDSVDNIGESAFSGCSSLTNITIPDSVTDIQGFVFSGCSNLVSIELHDKITSIGEWAFSYCSSLTNILIGDNVTNIGWGAFSHCTSLTSVTLGGGVESVGAEAFAGCSNLKTILIPDSVTAIGYYAFSNCLEITSIIIGDGVKSIGEGAFKKCSKLTSITIPNGVTSICDETFFGCASLMDITIPVSVTGIGYDAFYDCTFIENVYYSGDVADWCKIGFSGLCSNPMYYGDKLHFDGKFVEGVIEIPDEVTSLDDYVFYNCSGITEIMLPDSVESIGECAFYNCSNLINITIPTDVTNIGYAAFYNCSSLTNITIPDGLSGIRSDTFSGCYNMTSVMMGNDVSYIDYCAFADCSKLTDVYYSGSEKEWNDITIYGNNEPLKNATIHFNHTQHEYVATKTKQETCEDDGVVSYICVCGVVSHTETVAKTGHDLVHMSVPSTCVTSGMEYDLCDRCEKTFNVLTLPLGDHVYGDWITTTPVSCTQNGLKSRVCIYCDDIVEEVIYTTGHSMVFEVVVPTCETTGYTHHFCQNCDYSYNDSYIEALGHNFSKIVISPTCQHDGFDQYTCDACGYTYQENITSSVEHAYNSVVVAPTCDKQGYTVHTCLWCNDSYTDLYIDALGHRIVTDVIDPTCESGGYTDNICKVCNHSYKDNFVEALGHSYEELIVPPTCTEQGCTVHNCLRCSHTYTDSFVAAKNHSFGEWIVDQKATIYREGAEHRICATCGFTENETKEKVEVDPETNTDYGIANFTVVNAQSLEPIPNANIFVSTENDGENTFTTDENGKVTIPLPVGKQQISAYAEGCLTRNLRISIKPGINDVPKIGLSDLPTYEAKLTQKPMTIDEIENAGIDTSDPSNQHVYRYEVKLEFVAGIDWFSFFYFMNSEGSIIGGGSGESSGGGSGIVWTSNNNRDGGHIYVPPTPEREAMSIYPVSEYFYLIVHGEVKWLKEMYDVEMLVINNSMTDTLEDLKATLTLPDGLSLATMIGDQQSLVQNIGTIEEAGSKSVHWFVRGDKEGSYGLEALLEGMVMPFEEEIHDVFKSENQLQVLAGSTMSLHFEFPDTAYYGEDYPITITLENVSDKTIYNVSHMIQIEQGMEIYYSDGSVTQKIDESIWRGSHLLREFNPGDKIIIQTSVNIFFESEIIERQIQEMIEFIDGIEQLYNAYKAVKAGLDLVGTLSKSIVKCSKALDDFILNETLYSVAKVNLFKELKKEIGSLYTKYSKTGNKTLDAVLKLSNTGLDATLNMITSDPGQWLANTSINDMQAVLKDVKSLGSTISGSSQSSRKFDLFDSLRTAISALPVCFMLSNVTVTEAAGSTTSIPYSYSVTKAGPQYFGVSNVSKYIGNLAYVAVAEICETAIPGTLMLIPGFDDPFNKDEAIKYIQATEDEIKKFKAKSATGDVTFTVWVERNSKTKSAGDNISSDFILASYNETAVYEDGVMTFTGDGTISVTPTNLNGGTLYIEDSEGNVYTYEIDVVEQHDCVAGKSEVIISPTSEYDGFAVKCCKTCGEILEVEILEYDDCCETHNFSEWTTEFETSCSVSGIKSRDCSVCGFHEDVFIDPNEHTCVSWEPIQSATCSQEGLEKGFCSLCNEVVYRSLGFTAHTDGTWVVDKLPTCTESGLSVQKCSVCGNNTENIKTIEPTGHNWQDWHITQNPTANQEGIMKRGCTQCDYHETMTIPALIPDYVQGIKISSDNEVMKIGDTLTLSAIIKPTSASNQNIIWMSQDSDIVSVENGVLTAHKSGITVIVVESEDGGYKDYCRVRVIGITAVTDSVVIDHNNSLIYGIAPNLNNLDGYVQVIGNSDNLEYSSSKIGTGTSVILNNSDTEIDAYTVVLFGDVNGDGWYDGQDAVLVSCIANGMLTKEDVGGAIYMAADCNHDGVIDQLDVDLLNSAGALLVNVDQSETNDVLLETSSAFVDYVELIDQSADITPEDDSADISESVPEEVPMNPETNIIDMIIGFIKRIFKSLFSVSL